MKKVVGIELYKPEDIKDNQEKIIRKNAFIRGDGFFYLANGYTGSEPSKQLDSSAHIIGRAYLGDAFISKYLKKYQNTFSRPNYHCSEEIINLARSLNIAPEIIEDSIAKNTLNIKKIRTDNEFNMIRSILIQFYGMALFARIEQIGKNIQDVKYFDHSILPNPEWYGAKPTKEQIETMKLLLTLNKEDGTEIPDVYIKKMVLHYNDSIWHC